MRAVKRASELFDVVVDWCFGAAAFLLGVLTAVIVFDVITRYAFLRSNIWAMQSSEYILVYGTFLAAASILRNDRHVKIDFMLGRLSPRGQAILGIITSVIGAVVCAVLVWQGSKELAYSFQRNIYTRIQPWIILEWPTLAAVPFGSLLLSVQFVRRTCSFVVGLTKRGPQAA